MERDQQPPPNPAFCCWMRFCEVICASPGSVAIQPSSCVASRETSLFNNAVVTISLLAMRRFRSYIGTYAFESSNFRLLGCIPHVSEHCVRVLGRGFDICPSHHESSGSVNQPSVCNSAAERSDGLELAAMGLGQPGSICRMDGCWKFMSYGILVRTW